MSYKAQSTKDEPMKLKLHLTDIQSIFTREDMLENMDRVVDAICAFYGDIPPEAFFLSGEKSKTLAKIHAADLSRTDES